jgi:hypothetical protein
MLPTEPSAEGRDSCLEGFGGAVTSQQTICEGLSEEAASTPRGRPDLADQPTRSSQEERDVLEP